MGVKEKRNMTHRKVEIKTIHNSEKRSQNKDNVAKNKGKIT